MSLASTINDVLLVAAVRALIDERLYPVIAPHGITKPYAVWRRNGGDPLAVLAGNSRNRLFADVLVGAYAKTFDAADEISQALTDAVHAASSSGKGIVTPPIDGFEPESQLFSVVVQARLFYRA